MAETRPSVRSLTYYLKDGLKTKKELRQEAEKEARRRTRRRAIRPPTNCATRRSKFRRRSCSSSRTPTEHGPAHRGRAGEGHPPGAWTPLATSTPTKIKPPARAIRGLRRRPARSPRRDGTRVPRQAGECQLTTLAGPRNSKSSRSIAPPSPPPTASAAHEFQKRVAKLQRAPTARCRRNQTKERLSLSRRRCWTRRGRSALLPEARRLEEQIDKILIACAATRRCASRDENTPPSVVERARES